MLALDRKATGLRAVPAAPLPLAGLVHGRPVEEVADLLPCLFNLCRVAQSVALRLALGLAVRDDGALRKEIARDHALKLAVIWPVRLGLAARPVRAEAVLGGDFPATVPGFERYLATDTGIAPLLRAIAMRFGPGEGASGKLPETTPQTALALDAQENSVAARHLGHPVMKHIEATQGRGPLWRVVARALDLEAALHGHLPLPRSIGPGAALVPAARGLFAVRAEVRKGRVIRLTRVTPTDHMLAPGGIMAQALASLPAPKHHAARLLVDLLDLCTPITLKGGGHA